MIECHCHLEDYTITSLMVILLDLPSKMYRTQSFPIICNVYYKSLYFDARKTDTQQLFSVSKYQRMPLRLSVIFLLISMCWTSIFIMVQVETFEYGNFLFGSYVLQTAFLFFCVAATNQISSYM